MPIPARGYPSIVHVLPFPSFPRLRLPINSFSDPMCRPNCRGARAKHHCTHIEEAIPARPTQCRSAPPSLAPPHEHHSRVSQEDETTEHLRRQQASKHRGSKLKHREPSR